jgi:hypothetical protein
MIKSFAIGTVFLCLAILATPTFAQESWNLNGKVENGTAGAAVPQGLDIKVEIFQMGELLDTVHLETDAGGYFSSGEILGGMGIGYIISTEYLGISYSFESDYPVSNLPVTLVVYETIGESEVLATRSRSFVISSVEPDNGSLRIVELVNVENTSDRTFVPDLSQTGNMEFLRFSLPPSVAGLDVQTNLVGGHIIQIGSGFALTAPVPPGEYQVAYNYLVMYKGDSVDFNYSFPFGADIFRVLMPGEIGVAEVSGAEKLDTITIGDTSYSQSVASDLSRSDKVSIRLSNLPRPAILIQWRDALSDAWLLKIGAPSLMAIVLVGLVLYAIARKGEGRRHVGKGKDLSELQVHLEDIAVLDNRFQRGEIARDDYIVARRDLKSEILMLSRDSDKIHN